VIDIDFDMVVTVCEHNNETCPMSPKATPKIQVGFENPDGKAYDAFEATYAEINSTLLQEVSNFFKEEA